MLREIVTFFYKPGTKEIHKEKLIMTVSLSIVLLLVAIYGSKANKERRYERNVNPGYTVGVTIKRYKNIRSSNSTVKYKFTVNLRDIVEFEEIRPRLDNKITVQGGRYYVHFSSLNPKNCELLLDFPVPDSIKDCPQEGWNYLPGYE